MQSYTSETITSSGSRSAKKQSKLFTYSAVESKLDEDERMESCFKSLLIKIKDLSEKETHDALVAMVSSQNSSDEVSLGLLYGILTDAQTAPKFYRDLTLLASNSLNKVLSTVNWVILEMYTRLLDAPRVQLLWFVRELVKNNINHTDMVCMHLMRVVLAGCYSPQNTWLIDALLTILQENKSWLDKNATLIGYAVFFHLRLIPDHTSSQHEALRNREIRFCISYLRERFMDCLNIIQRELGRALLIVGRIPEFERLWADILYNPTALSPSFTGVWQLLSYSNPRRNTMNKIVLCRLTVEIERKIYFFLHNVASSNQKSYLEWFHRQYLTPLDSQTIRSDLIRYVCCMVHPPNAVLASDVVPRWAFITHLLTTCQNPVEVQLMRLSLFYDWMFFDPEKESIMNIEPAVLVLFNSLKTQPLIASSLMDFVCRLVYNFCAPVSVQIKNCVYLSLRQLQDRKVVPSLSPLLDSNRFDPELQCLVKEIFEEFFNSREDKKEELGKSVPTSSHAKGDDAAGDSPVSGTDSGLEIEDDKSLDQEKFSDDEMETSTTAVAAISRDNSSQDDEDEEDMDENDSEKRRTKNYTTSTDLINPSDDPMPIPPTESLLQQLDDTLRPLVGNLQKSSEGDVQGDTVYKILQQILTLDNFDEEQASALAECLCGLFKPFFARKVFPFNYDSETDLEETLQAPVFVIFRNLCFTPDQEMASRRPQLFLTSEMYLKQPRVGYLLLYFLAASNTGSDKTSAYRGICSTLDEEVEDMLLKDLTLCQQEDYRLFVYLIPYIYEMFPQFALQASEFMHLIVSTIDAVQLQNLICEVVQGNLTMFRKDFFSSLLNSSLSWETIEQYFFWQLVNADDVPLDWTLSVIPKLNFPNHAEAMANILLMLRRMDKEPSMLLVRHLLGREPYKKGDLFSISSLKVYLRQTLCSANLLSVKGVHGLQYTVGIMSVKLLTNDYEEKMVDLISSLLQKTSNEANEKSKVKKSQVKGVNLDSILGHLDMFRQYNKQSHTFFTKESIQQSIQDVRKSAPEALKAKYSELFGMMEVLDSIKESKSSRRGRKAAAVQQHDSSDDERHISKNLSPTKVVKKKRKIVESDSE